MGYFRTPRKDFTGKQKPVKNSNNQFRDRAHKISYSKDSGKEHRHKKDKESPIKGNKRKFHQKWASVKEHSRKK